jgi:hypothetical protein
MKMKWWGFVTGLMMAALGAVTGLQAEEWTPGAPTPVPTPVYKVASQQVYLYREAPLPPRILAGRIGFGLDMVPGASPASVFGGVISAPNAIGLRYWATEKVGLDLLVAMDMNSIQTGTGSSSGSTSGSGTPGSIASGFGFGAGIKYNVSQPSRNMLAQLVVKASTATSTQSDPTGLFKLNTSTTALFAGAGFEAFVGGWDWLSLEGSLGFSLTSATVKPESATLSAAAASAATQSSSRMSLGGAGFTPLNISIHAYF